MAKSKKFGTFGGVFTPSILTILGVIMYLRMPMISGEAGLLGTLGIILVAHLISITTGLSVSSIATDKKVKEGGTYYIISRSLGLPIGGTLGLALFVGLSFSVSLYLIGFAESFLGYWDLPMDINHIRITGSIILFLVTIITFISTSLAIKTQYIIMAAIFLSLLSIFFGHHDFTPVTPNLFGKGTGVSLMVLFGIFFPAVTGFEAGVSMSGDLKDPKKSIPLGTIMAIAIGLFVYIGLAFFYAFTVDGNLLATDSKALFKIALVPQLVIAGIWGATLSSALGSILAAPRILQSTALDKITPNIFARGTGKAKEPRNALLLTFLIAEAGILVGELDVIARVVSVFFITTYGFLNLSAAFESITSADFRPSFKIPSWVSILGFMACLLVMIQLDFLAMIAAVVILGLLFIILKRRQLVLESGDAWGSVWATLVRNGLQRLNKSSLQIRNWRPNIILFCGQDQARPHLVELAASFAGSLGMYTAFEMVETKEERLVKDKRYFSLSGKNEELQIHQHSCREIYEGMDEISRVYGFSGIEPDTILMGWSKKKNSKDKFLVSIKSFESSDFNSIFLSYNDIKKYGEKKTIDIWWSGWGNNLTFALFLLRHFTTSGDWKDAKIRLLLINTMPDRTETIYKKIQQIITLYRINLEIKIINNSVDRRLKQEIIISESSGTDLTFIGIPDKQYNHIEQTYDEVMSLTQHLGTFLLINSSSRFESFDLGLEEKVIEKDSLPEPELKLPPLKPSKYNIINEDIAKIDENGQKVLTLFFQKAFGPVFSELSYMSDDLITAIHSVSNQLEKLKSIEDTYRRRKTLIKIKNDFYFRTNLIFNDLSQKKLALQKEALENGINWYIDQLDQDLLKFPLKIVIPYTKEDLTFSKNDPFRLKLSILKKRMTHPFSKTTIPGKIRYNEIANYYLKNNRHFYLASFLKKFQSDLFELFSEIRAMIISSDTMLENLFDKASDSALLIESVEIAKRDNANWIDTIETELSSLSQNSQNRLMLEFRKNLQLMSTDMGKADINHRINRKSRNQKYYNELINNNSTFPELWYEYTLHQINKIYMDILFQALRSRIKDKTSEFNLGLAQQLDKGLRTELGNIRSLLEDYHEDSSKIPELSINTASFEEKITLLKDFSSFGKEILKLALTLPENMDVSSNEDQLNSQTVEDIFISVPVRKITRFYIEANFIGKTHDELELIAESIKNSVFIIHDLLSLTRFNLENIPEDLTDKKQIINSITKDVCQKIEKEEGKINGVSKQISGLIENSLEEVFEKLSAYKIGSTLTEYSGFIREHQSKKVRKRFASYTYTMQSALKSLTTRILYSRSEWILLAKKVMEADEKITYNQKILNLVEDVSPRDKVLSMLPQFYKNLFSGRSNIGEDFWIDRDKEEEMFHTGVLRNIKGFQGGIMVIGERNSGKTSFCRYACEYQYKKEKILHLFPLQSGSTQLSDFTNELQRLTNITGDINMIMENLPQGTVMVIHDLELWWERSLTGWEVIKQLINLINDYSTRILFVVNMNPYAFKMMNKVVNLNDAFISVITLRPFDTKDIQEIIIRRHRSSGLKFVLHKKDEDDLSDITLARLFNKYFNYSEGNPGTALITWLENITSVSDKVLHIQIPRLPDTTILNALDEDWKILLAQLILHKRLTFDKISRIFMLDEVQTKKLIAALSRTGLIEERREKLYIVNPYIEHHLVKVLKKEELL